MAEVFPVVDTELGRIAMIPCGEVNVPEVARVYMMQGAEVFLHHDKLAAPDRPGSRQGGARGGKYGVCHQRQCCWRYRIFAGWIHSRGRSHIIDYLGRTLAYEDGNAETVAVSAMIDVEELRAARKRDTGTANPLLRARWEMYRPFFASASFYPPNQFLEAPMADRELARPVLAASLRNMAKAGIIVDQ